MMKVVFNSNDIDLNREYYFSLKKLKKEKHIPFFLRKKIKNEGVNNGEK